MNYKVIKIVLITMCLSVLITGCTQTAQAPTQTVLPPTEAPTQVSPTLEPTAVPTEIPTEVPTLEPTVAPTETPVTVVVLDTATPEMLIPASGEALLTAKQNTNCRKYPMRNSNALGYLLVGKYANVIGIERTGDWFLIYNPSNNGGMPCWVWAGSTEYSGVTSKLGIVINTYNDGYVTVYDE